MEVNDVCDDPVDLSAHFIRRKKDQNY